MRRKPQVEHFDRCLLERVAKILGEQSAAACALRAADEHLGRGGQVGFFMAGDTILVAKSKLNSAAEVPSQALGEVL